MLTGKVIPKKASTCITSSACTTFVSVDLMAVEVNPWVSIITVPTYGSHVLLYGVQNINAQLQMFAVVATRAIVMSDSFNLSKRMGMMVRQPIKMTPLRIPR